METAKYESMLLAITYLEAVKDNDKVQQKIVLDSTDPNDLLEGMVAVSLVMIQWSVNNSQGRYSMKEIIQITRNIALDKASQ